MKPKLSAVLGFALGIVAAASVVAPTVRYEMAREGTTELASNDTQAFVHIPMAYFGYELSPAANALASVKQSLGSLSQPVTHRIERHMILVIDSKGIQTMEFPGVGGSVTGNERWTSGACRRPTMPLERPRASDPEPRRSTCRAAQLPGYLFSGSARAGPHFPLVL